MLDNPPVDVKEELAAVVAALEQVVPARSARNLLIGTWNVRSFDRYTPAWRSHSGDSPIRDLSNVLVIAEIVRRFDVVAIQEIRRTGQALLRLMEALGDGWSYVLTDVTAGDAGNHERLAFVFDTRRLKLSGLACEIVVAAADDGVPEPVMSRQFARTPYAVSFTNGQHRFTLVTLHVLYGDRAEDRLPELRQIAQWLADWKRAKDVWGENLIALGDFNIDRRGDPLHQAFTSTGLRAPDNLNLVPRTIFDDPDPTAPPDHRHFYDQIAWFDTGRSKLSMPYVNAGMFDFADGLVPADSRNQLSWRISDHYPLWCEFASEPE